MKILIVLPDLHGGGAERLHVNLARHWTDLGHDVDFILLRKSGDLLKLVPDKVNIISINAYRIRQAVIPIYKILKKIKPDVVLSAMWPLTSITVISWIISRRKSKLFLSDHVVLSLDSTNNIGVPTAPKLTAVELAIKAIISAKKGLKPMKTKIGATIAAGVPNPAIPSNKLPNNHAMIMACILTSGEIPTKKDWIIFSFPLFLSKAKIQIALKIIRIISKAINTPFKKDAPIQLRFNFQKKTVIIKVNNQVINIE